MYITSFFRILSLPICFFQTNHLKYTLPHLQHCLQIYFSSKDRWLNLFSESDVEPCGLHTEESKPNKIVCHFMVLFSLSWYLSNEFKHWKVLNSLSFCGFSVDDVEGIESLRWDDQQKIRKYIEGGGPSKTTSASYSENGIEVSQTSRATCKHCSQKILKGEVGQ